MGLLRLILLIIHQAGMQSLQCLLIARKITSYKDCLCNAVVSTAGSLPCWEHANHQPGITRSSLGNLMGWRSDPALRTVRMTAAIPRLEIHLGFKLLEASRSQFLFPSWGFCPLFGVIFRSLKAVPASVG